ncbi:MAG TPA: hypothetical protein VHM91_06110 [Verrucomicrobiales bacterium]|nr:hypothetical protein [Verrucomicrobiales bacterium]
MKSPCSLYLSLLFMGVLRLSANVLHAAELEVKSKVILLGGGLDIRATGAQAKAILAEAGKGPANRKLVLYLNGIEIPGLKSTYTSTYSGAEEVDAHLKAGQEAESKKTAEREADEKRNAAAAEVAKANAEQAAVAADVIKAGEKRDAAPADQKEAAEREFAAAMKKRDAAEKEYAVVMVKQAAAEKDYTAKAEELKKANTASDRFNGKEVIVHFTVERKSEDKVSREAWDAFFRQDASNSQDAAVAIAIGSLHPVPVAYGTSADTPFKATEYPVWGYCAGLFCLVLCGLILWRWPHMLRDRGDPANAFSLGRTQMAFWGVIVLSCFAGVAAASYSLEYIPAQVLVLLGISAATGLSATVIDNGALPTKKSDRTGINGFFDDICIGGDNGASFHRVQVVLWTVVLGIYFIWNVVHMMSMPVFAETLLVLMAISNGTYLGFKTKE